MVCAMQALLTAADIGNLEQVKQLVDQGTSVNVVDETQTTPLHWAAFRGHTEIVDLLIENGALVNTVDEGGFSPLDSSAEMDHVKVGDPGSRECTTEQTLQYSCYSLQYPTDNYSYCLVPKHFASLHEM